MVKISSNYTHMKVETPPKRQDRFGANTACEGARASARKSKESGKGSLALTAGFTSPRGRGKLRQTPPCMRPVGVSRPRLIAKQVCFATSGCIRQSALKWIKGPDMGHQPVINRARAGHFLQVNSMAQHSKKEASL